MTKKILAALLAASVLTMAPVVAGTTTLPGGGILTETVNAASEGKDYIWDDNGNLTILTQEGFNFDSQLKDLLVNVKISEDASFIPQGAFVGCTNLTSIDLSNSDITIIGNEAFSGCTKLGTVTFPSTLTGIGSYAFRGCSGLTTVDLSGSKIEVIGSSVFSGCTNLQTIRFPSTLTEIGRYAFSGCSGLTTLDFTGVTSLQIGTFTFNNCTNITEVKTNSTDVQKAIIDALSGTPYLTSITVDGTDYAISELQNPIEVTFESISITANTAKIGDASLFEKETVSISVDSDMKAKGTVGSSIPVSVGNGRHTLKVTIGNGTQSKSYDLTIIGPSIEVTEISLDQTSVQLAPGAETTLVATVKPDDATDKTVTWETSDPAVATVENGHVVAVGVGTATITATAGEYSAACTVTVKRPVDVSSLDDLEDLYDQLKGEGAFTPEEETYLDALFDRAQQVESQAALDRILESIRQAIAEFTEEEDTYTPSTTISDGFHTYSIGTMYYKDGKRTRGWADIDGARYYFDEKGIMATGWKEIEPESGDWYHFGEDGALDYGWYKEGNVWYYLDPVTGLMYNDGLAAIDKSTYYFYDWGGMASDWWYEAEDGWYFFGGSGAMKAAQWLEWKGDWYYLTETGKMAADTSIGGYYVGAGGVWVK